MNDDQAPLNPLPLTVGDIRTSFPNISQDIKAQAQASTTRAQAMNSQAYREVGHPKHQLLATMASRSRNFTRMNPPTFYGSKFEDDPLEFIDEIYKVVNAM